jgi:hypothetical protein
MQIPLCPQLLHEPRDLVRVLLHMQQQQPDTSCNSLAVAQTKELYSPAILDNIIFFNKPSMDCSCCSKVRSRRILSGLFSRFGSSCKRIYMNSLLLLLQLFYVDTWGYCFVGNWTLLHSWSLQWKASMNLESWESSMERMRWLKQDSCFRSFA